MLGRLALLTALVALLGGPASAQALHAIPTGFSWRLKPSGDDIARVYPNKARLENKFGWTVIECQTEPTGDIRDCLVLGESPAGYGFGEAGLKLARRFQLDTKKTAPTELTGGVVTIPIMMTMDGSLPLRNTLAGDQSVLLSPSANGVTLCPTDVAPGQKCRSHRFVWATRPSLVETAPFVRSAGARPATTAVICPIGEDMRLRACTQAGPADPSQIAAMNGLIPLFAAPPQADDKTPAKDGFALIQFDWPALKLAVETSVLTKAP
jgi:hypothetical protein